MQKNLNKVLIIDVGNQAVDGRLRDRDFLNGISHTLLPIYELVKKCDSLGLNVVTPDEILNHREKYQDQEMLLLSHLAGPRTKELVRAGVTPFLLMCQESPMIATRFYLSFRQITKRFAYTMAFSGMKRRAHGRTAFIPARFPIFWNQEKINQIPFESREFLALVAANKSAPAWKALLIKLFYGRKVKLIYPLRKEWIKSLAISGDIHLYGSGWDKDADPNIQAVNRGLIPAGGKSETLARYRFTLCFENAIFPGYLTEKIFDAFMAGTVPVYLGDPEVESIVPKDAFIDAREFKDAIALKDHLKNMTAEKFERYKEASQRFLASPAFLEFQHQSFVDRVLNLIYLYERR